MWNGVVRSKQKLCVMLQVGMLLRSSTATHQEFARERLADLVCAYGGVEHAQHEQADIVRADLVDCPHFTPTLTISSRRNHQAWGLHLPR